MFDAVVRQPLLSKLNERTKVQVSTVFIIVGTMQNIIPYFNLFTSFSSFFLSLSLFLSLAHSSFPSADREGMLRWKCASPQVVGE
jgi:hypothetical protein